MVAPSRNPAIDHPGPAIATSQMPSGIPTERYYAGTGSVGCELALPAFGAEHMKSAEAVRLDAPISIRALSLAWRTAAIGTHERGGGSGDGARPPLGDSLSLRASRRKPIGGIPPVAFRG